jgi:hypothetical protein
MDQRPTGDFEKGVITLLRAICSAACEFPRALPVWLFRGQRLHHELRRRAVEDTVEQVRDS